MNDYGFQILNLNGQVIADSNFSIYTPIQYGTFTVGSYTPLQTIDIYFQTAIPFSKMPQFFMQIPMDGSILSLQTYIMSEDSIVGVKILGYSYTGSYNVNYVVAAPVSAIDVLTENYGIIAYDSNGLTTFASTKKMMLVNAVGSLIPGETLNHSVLTGERYVAIAGIAGIKIYNELVAFGGIKSNNDTSVSLDWNIALQRPYANNALCPIRTGVIIAELGF